MQKEIKVDRPEPDVPEPSVGDLVESKATGNILLVTEDSGLIYIVVVIATSGAHPNEPFGIDKDDVKPFIGTVTITQRP